jgi:hypothetical protein
MKRWFKNIIIALTLVGVVGLSFSPPAVPKAHALLRIPVMNIIREAQGKFDNINIFGNLTNQLLQWADKIILPQIKQVIVKMIQDAILGSVQGGGSPKFVTSYRAYIENITIDVMENFGDEVNSTNYCASFSNSIKNAFPYTTGQGGVPPATEYSQKSSCTLGNFIGGNTPDRYEAFSRDFSVGGWEGLAAAWAPQNNFLISSVKTSDEMTGRIQDAVFEGLEKAAAGDGFLGKEECLGEGRDCFILTPGSIVKGLTEKVLGADVDFVVNADTFFDLAVNALNLLMSRTIDEGLTKISNIFDQNELDTLIAKSDAINNSNFDSSKKNTTDNIDEIIALRRNVVTLLGADILQNQAYLNNLTSWQGQITAKLGSNNSTQCNKTFTFNSLVNITQLKSDLQNEVARVQALLDVNSPGSLVGKRKESNDIIDELTAAKAEIVAFKNDNEGRSGLASKRDELARKLNPAEVAQLKLEAEDSRDANKEVIAQMKTDLGDLMGKFNQCNNFS